MTPRAWSNLQTKIKSQISLLTKHYGELNLEESLYLFRKQRKVLRRLDSRLKRELSERAGGLL